MQERYHRGTWLIAVSTGPDSMALLNMCLEDGMHVAVAHVNYHHQRCAEEEETYIRAFCRDHGIPLHVCSSPFHPAGNFEAAARQVRYAFFAETVRANGYAGVLTAHQQDDRIETFLMQQSSGRIPACWGIAEASMIDGIEVARPLLGMTKAALIAYCDSHGIRYYIDETNSDTAYERNRIRQETVAPMDAFQRQMVCREIDALNAEWKERRCRVRAELNSHTVTRERYIAMAETDRLTLLRMLADSDAPDLSIRHRQAVDRIIRQKEDFLIPIGDRVLTLASGLLVVREKPSSYIFTCPSAAAALALGSQHHFRVIAGEPGTAAVTLHTDDFPIRIRSWQTGDRIRLRFGRKSVHRFFIDRHIPLYERSTWPVIENAQGEVILVPGLGCDVDHYSIKPDLSVLQCSDSEEGADA